MAATLVKGGNVSLRDIAPQASVLKVVMCWQTLTSKGSDLDINASCLMLSSDGKARDNKDFVFCNNRVSPDGAIEYLGRDASISSAGVESDDADITVEAIKVDLAKVSPDVTKLAFAVFIYQARERKQSFAQVTDALIGVADNSNNKVIVSYGLSDDLDSYQAVVFGEIYRHKGAWKFRAVGDGFYDGVASMLRSFGLKANMEAQAAHTPQAPTSVAVGTSSRADVLASTASFAVLSHESDHVNHRAQTNTPAEMTQNTVSSSAQQSVATQLSTVENSTSKIAVATQASKTAKETERLEPLSFTKAAQAAKTAVVCDSDMGRSSDSYAQQKRKSSSFIAGVVGYVCVLSVICVLSVMLFTFIAVTSKTHEDSNSASTSVATIGHGGLASMKVGLGWDPNRAAGGSFDLDLGVLMYTATGELVPYNSLEAAHENAILSCFYSKNGSDSEEDDEWFFVDLTRLEPQISRVVFTASIYQADLNSQNFGMIPNTYIRIFDYEHERELVKYDLTKDASGCTTMYVREFYRENGVWKFRPDGQCK